ncbi:MAG: endopeptidase La [Firmicutes bacterium]|nr:endopeptidase La [Bacillota bacterium]
MRLDFINDRIEREIEEIMRKNEQILLVGYAKQEGPEQRRIELNKLPKIGTLCYVKQILRHSEDQKFVVFQGVQRAEVDEFIWESEESLYAYVKLLPNEFENSDLVDVAANLLIERFKDLQRESPKFPTSLLKEIKQKDDPSHLSFVLASHLNLTFEEKFELLKEPSLENRLLKLSVHVERAIERRKLEVYIQQKTQEKMSQNQREYFLREQMKVIQSELGDVEEKEAEKERMLKRLDEIVNLAEEYKEKIRRDILRLERLHASSPEAGVLRQYLETVLRLPWDEQSQDVLDINFAHKVLDEDHYGLDKPKERILEYLAVRQLSGGLKGPIICLVGPPGTGKTSLGRSVARALNRQFVRMSLGGVRDEAEIRGHRRTYVASMPGRIIQSIMQSGVNNPLFLLDEIDKTSSDFRGDPASALLEVLDPEQNSTFADHYLEVPFDLSKVLFLTTANDARRIPRPLLDRMEIIELSSYTEEEKLEIAKRHLIPKQLEENGLKPESLTIPDKTLRVLISRYTRESGVRQLERQIGAICRKRARQILEGREESLNLTIPRLERFLGAYRYSHTKAERTSQIGVATGMVWTEMGGEILPIEVGLMPGKGELILTGKLGEVMRESASIALSYVRANSELFGLPSDFHKTMDIHIHVPEGAVPKEGPSAGITLLTALISALTKEPVRNDIAMTGELTLRGNILPIGGLKEKLLAAYRAGLQEAIIPEENRKDLEEIPENILKTLQVHFVEEFDQALPKLIPGLNMDYSQLGGLL